MEQFRRHASNVTSLQPQIKSSKALIKGLSEEGVACVMGHRYASAFQGPVVSNRASKFRSSTVRWHVESMTSAFKHAHLPDPGSSPATAPQRCGGRRHLRRRPQCWHMPFAVPPPPVQRFSKASMTWRRERCIDMLKSRLLPPHPARSRCRPKTQPAVSCHIRGHMAVLVCQCMH